MMRDEDMNYEVRVLAVSAFALVSGCAPAAGPGSTNQVVDRDRAMRNDPNELINLTPGPSSASATIHAPAARVWPLVPSAFSLLSIPVTRVDTVNRIIHGNITARREFAGRPMDALVDCGSSLTGPNAMSYTVNIRLGTQVGGPTPETATLRTVVDASGTSSGGTTVRCSSTGGLENEILARIKTGLGQ